MAKFLSFLHFNKRLVLQLLLVVVAFLIMVAIGSYFGVNIVNRNVASYGDEVISASAETIEAYLSEFAMTLENISFTIENLHNQGGDIGVLRREIENWTAWLRARDLWNDDSVTVYGVGHGIFTSGGGWVPPDDYVPQSRPWYTGARERGGGIYYTDPYIDEDSGRHVTILFYEGSVYEGNV